MRKTKKLNDSEIQNFCCYADIIRVIKINENNIGGKRRDHVGYAYLDLLGKPQRNIPFTEPKHR
jgi:hypothetical protein